MVVMRWIANIGWRMVEENERERRARLRLAFDTRREARQSTATVITVPDPQQRAHISGSIQ